MRSYSLALVFFFFVCVCVYVCVCACKAIIEASYEITITPDHICNGF